MFIFAKPYCSREGEANKNSKGLIRQDFPKGTDFRDITDELVMRVQNILNSRPRKIKFYDQMVYKLLINNKSNIAALSV